VKNRLTQKDQRRLLKPNFTSSFFLVKPERKHPEEQVFKKMGRPRGSKRVVERIVKGEDL